MNIIIKKHLLLYKGYKLKCSIGKSGVKILKKEGDLAIMNVPVGEMKFKILEISYD